MVQVSLLLVLSPAPIELMLLVLLDYLAKITWHLNMYGLLTKCEVKMAGYWPSSFLRVYGPRRSRGP